MEMPLRAQARKLGIVDSIIASVRRAGRITKRLLTFARNLEASVEEVNLEEVVREVFSFVEKEAQMREIVITSYSIHYTKLYECGRPACASCLGLPLFSL